MASPSSKIALPYRLYFLYLDPIMALGGVYLILTDPQKFITSTVPAPLSVIPTPLTPVVQLLLTNIAALYAYLAFNESVVLRITEEVAVWKAIIAVCMIRLFGGGELICDRHWLSRMWGMFMVYGLRHRKGLRSF